MNALTYTPADAFLASPALADKVEYVRLPESANALQRAYFAENSLPWLDPRGRIVPRENLATFESEFNALATPA